MSYSFFISQFWLKYLQTVKNTLNKLVQSAKTGTPDPGSKLAQTGTSVSPVSHTLLLAHMALLDPT
jgi:hypothetical protein